MLFDCRSSFARQSQPRFLLPKRLFYKPRCESERQTHDFAIFSFPITFTSRVTLVVHRQTPSSSHATPSLFVTPLPHQSNADSPLWAISTFRCYHHPIWGCLVSNQNKTSPTNHRNGARASQATGALSVLLSPASLRAMLLRVGCTATNLNLLWKKARFFLPFTCHSP